MIGNFVGLGVFVFGGYVIIVEVFKDFIVYNDLFKCIFDRLVMLDVEDVVVFIVVGKEICSWVIDVLLQLQLDQDICSVYRQLCDENGGGDVVVVVCFLVIVEDLFDVFFVGQQEIFFNVIGVDDVVYKVKEVFVLLYNDCVIVYCVYYGFKYEDVFLFFGVQLMVCLGVGLFGVLFILDIEFGFCDVVFVIFSFGLGEMVVQGVVNFDEFYVYKFMFNVGKLVILCCLFGSKVICMVYLDVFGECVCIEDILVEICNIFLISDEDVQELFRQVLIIEKYYGCLMDIEWVKDGVSGKLFIVQVCLEMVKLCGYVIQIEWFMLNQKDGKVLVEGCVVGVKIGVGIVCVVKLLDDMVCVQFGDVLIVDMIDFDWELVMKCVLVIVINCGGCICYVVIIVCELGVLVVVGLGNVIQVIVDGQEVIVSCVEGDIGFIYEGKFDCECIIMDLGNMLSVLLKIMMNVVNLECVFDFGQLFNVGIGLVCLEMIIVSYIGIYFNVLLEYDCQDVVMKKKIDEKIVGYVDLVSFYVNCLVEGIVILMVLVVLNLVIVCLLDFKFNEYVNLIGGSNYELYEENLMIGFCGVSCYVDLSFLVVFVLECKVVLCVCNEMGLDNLWVMILFVCMLEEGCKVVQVLEQNGFKQGENGLKIIMMCEVLFNVLFVDEFLDIFDGFLIGFNDLIQFILGLDCDFLIVVYLFDEWNLVVKKLLLMVIKLVCIKGKYVGICGQGLLDYLDLVEWLMQEGIELVLLNLDIVVDIWLCLVKLKVNG